MGARHPRRACGRDGDAHLPPARQARRLGSAAAAESRYLRAVMQFWAIPEIPEAQRKAGERNILAPARRRCGLASNDAEEAVDRIMQEPGLGRIALAHEALEKDHALTFTTSIRRLTQSVTTLAATGRAVPEMLARLEALASRLERVGLELSGSSVAHIAAHSTQPPADLQLERLTRQVEVLERAAAMLQTGAVLA